MVTAVAEFPHVAIHHQALSHPTPTPENTPSLMPSVTIKHHNTQIRTQGMSFLTHFPFRVLRHHTAATIPTGCPYSSAPTNSWLSAIPMKPFSTLVLKRPTRVIATTTKICTTGCSTLCHHTSFYTPHALPPTYHNYPSLLKTQKASSS